MVGNPEHEQIRRMVTAMEDVADSYADQNLWDLARRAWAAIRDTKREQLASAYGATPEQVQQLTERQRRFQAQYGPTGRMQVNQVPLTFSTDPAQGYTPPDYAAQLGEVERRLMLKAPQYTGETTADKVDQLAQDYQAAVKQVEQQNQGIEKLKRELREKDAAFQDVIGQIRGALDPDGQFEDESLIVLARERMNALAARKQDLVQLQERISTQIEANSAEMLRRVLGAAANETLGQAAKRVAESAKSGWEQYRALNDRQRNEFHQLSDKVRELVGAVDESESDDHYMPEQPTLDAVRRVIRRLADAVPYDATADSWSEFMSRIQEEWDGINEVQPLPWEREA